MNEENIKEINAHISDALAMWSDILLKAENDNWAYELNFSDDDLFNAFSIFDSVWGNRAIKDGILDEKNVVDKMTSLKECLKEVYNIDTIELAKKALCDE